MSKALIRSLTLASLTGAFLMSLAVGADAQELADYLEEANQATFAGKQATWCTYGDHTEFSVATIEHAGSLVMVEGADSAQMVGGGRYSVVGEGGVGIAISDWSSSEANGRYVAADVTAETRLGRDVTIVSINEGDMLRARIWFDDATGAALNSEVYDDTGELFRLSWMLDFDPNPRKIFTALRDVDAVYDVVVTADADGLPETVTGYSRVDTYAGPDESLHAFYTDGLFSFSVFVIEGEIANSPFVGADTTEVDGGKYSWILTPSELWVQWSGGGFTYVLVGDLPPDHLDQVLTELPQASHGNLFARLWRGIFG